MPDDFATLLEELKKISEKLFKDNPAQKLLDANPAFRAQMEYLQERRSFVLPPVIGVYHHDPIGGTLSGARRYTNLAPPSSRIDVIRNLGWTKDVILPITIYACSKAGISELTVEKYDDINEKYPNEILTATKQDLEYFEENSGRMHVSGYQELNSIGFRVLDFPISQPQLCPMKLRISAVQYLYTGLPNPAVEALYGLGPF